MINKPYFAFTKVTFVCQGPTSPLSCSKVKTFPQQASQAKKLTLVRTHEILNNAFGVKN